MSLELKRHLVHEYGGFADKRIKNPEIGTTFIVDDRDHVKPNFAFCRVCVDVGDDDEIELRLSHDVPLSSTIRLLVMEKGGEIEEQPPSGVDSMRVSLKANDYGFLRTLADAIDDITAPGHRYSVRSYKFSCPRTARSLNRLADALERYVSKAT